jgi:uncharacterized protein YbaR (Trm112 family)
MSQPKGYICPACNSSDFTSVQSAAIDSELLECQRCKRAYEVKYAPDGTAKLVSV